MVWRLPKPNKAKKEKEYTNDIKTGANGVVMATWQGETFEVHELSNEEYEGWQEKANQAARRILRHRMGRSPAQRGRMESPRSRSATLRAKSTASLCCTKGLTSGTR